jgi:hypothetical protein
VCKWDRSGAHELSKRWSADGDERRRLGQGHLLGTLCQGLHTEIAASYLPLLMLLPGPCCKSCSSAILKSSAIVLVLLVE